MAPDPHQGGRLEDMAAEGTTIPGDAGKQNLIPSVPRPDQINPDPSLAHADIAHGADNASDIPRSVNDPGQTGEVLTGTGDQMNSSIEKKNLDDANYEPGAKGHDRDAKHAINRKDNPHDSSKHGASSHDVEAAPGEEELGQDELLEKRGAK
ncbi:hypothetical protein P153DRAFT_396903 [Dothidotthia symphoricarpi CBS 119687]|uniref:Uncharacterized protein n=1 Tax=Dothidotthia symphoricarpi CBS 119687 TaxID=1392245 RepID=A0A6A6AF44_9PLEO|nr:uncharacterized protein P153DRAFT_396903 [Dothidotthia symphoricarpi CBS 119687]KAF2129648.1 hypothetical protein P153DRAFT_396903 [Dothidotthia symphoricarpi CBS 119687]